MTNAPAILSVLTGCRGMTVTEICGAMGLDWRKAGFGVKDTLWDLERSGQVHGRTDSSGIVYWTRPETLRVEP